MADLTYTTQDIRRHVSHNAYVHGETYRAKGRVFVAERKGNTIEGTVRGHEHLPYRQTITLQDSNGKTLIFGRCTCPVGQNCKHVVAVLLQDLRKQGPVEPPKPPSPEDIAERRIARMLDAPAQQFAGPSAPTSASGLPSAVTAWIETLHATQKSASEDYPPGTAQRLVYVFGPLTRPDKIATLGVQAISVRLLKDGRFSDNGKPFKFQASPYAVPAQFVRPADLSILRALDRSRQDYGSVFYSLAQDESAPILTEILATGRARWQNVNGPVLHAGEVRQARFNWVLGEDAMLRPRLEAGEGLSAFAGAPPVYVDLEAGSIGPLETGYLPAVAATLLAAPPVPVDGVAALNQLLEERVPGLASARPAEPPKRERIATPPKPQVHLSAVLMPSPAAPGYYGFSGYEPVLDPVPIARVSFRYGPVTVALGERRVSITAFVAERLVTIERDPAAERRHLNALLALGLLPLGEYRRPVPRGHELDLVAEGGEPGWLDFAYRAVPRLEAEGWTITIAETFPHRLVEPDGDFDAEVREGSGIDWFELHVGVMVDGERIDLVGPIIALLRTPGFDPAALPASGDESKPYFLPLADGRSLALPPMRLAAMVAAIQDLVSTGAGGEGRLRLSRADVAGLSDFEAATAGLGLVWRGGDALRDMGRKLTSSGGIPAISPPDTFKATLRPYQAQGHAWLAFLRDVGFGGILADDMGLGKTVQALALIAGEKAAGRLDVPVLVIAPTSLMANWRREAERFAPDLRVLTLHGLERRKSFDRIADHDLVLTTYPLVARDHAVLGATRWHLLILDEAQTVKNPEASTTQRIFGLEARHRFCLTGTPLENHLGELWSLFAFAVPGLLGDIRSFNRDWRNPIEKRGDGAKARLLARRIRPFLLRRTKEEVAGDLPPKTEIAERIEFEAGQRDLYDSIRLTMHKKVREAIAAKGFARSHIVILDALLKLRQACCDPRLLKLGRTAAGKAKSAKLERLEEMVTELLAEGRRILVFSQFTSMLDLIRPRLDELGIAYSLLTGDTRDRETQVQRFQGGTTPVFLVSLKAGGVGLNLTAADTVILYDPWWNPAVEEQAIDRAHRIGQDKPVFVHKLVAVGTIEEKMEQLKEKKRALAESMFDQDGAPTLAMTESDLEMLFSAA